MITTVLTNVTGFLFPFAKLLPSHVLGGLSLVILPIAIVALYEEHLAGGWRRGFVVADRGRPFTSMSSSWIVQLFSKFPLLTATAPTQKEPPFAITHLVVLALFIWLGQGRREGVSTLSGQCGLRPLPSRAEGMRIGG